MMDGVSFNAVKCLLIERLKSVQPSGDLLGCSAQQKQLVDLLSRTYEYGDSNSVLVIGPAGSGKTALVHLCLSSLRDKFPKFDTNAVVVNLNGLIHTDERLCLEAITLQLKLDNVVGDKVFGSHADNLTFLLESLKSGKSSTSKTVVIIMDNFDLFCAHGKQMLLYALLDAAQNSHTPLFILGVTRRLDVVELLEKRVKSRFSHRVLQIFNQFSFDDYLELARDLLLIDAGNGVSQTAVKEWNANVNELLTDPKAKAMLHHQFDISKSVRFLKHFLLTRVCQLFWTENGSSHLISLSSLNAVQKQLLGDRVAAILKDLSVLELSLLIGMQRLLAIFDIAHTNFETVYSDYEKLVRDKIGIQQYDRDVAMKAYERLEFMELIQPAEGQSQASTPKEYQMMSIAVESHLVRQCIDKYVGLPTDLVIWAKNKGLTN